MAGHFAWTLLALCLLLFDPYLPLHPFTTVTFGSPFEILADPFREEVALSPSAYPSCDETALRVLPLSCDAGFLRKLPETCVTIRFHFKLQLPSKHFVPFFMPAVRCSRGICIPSVPLRLPLLVKLLLTAISSAPPLRSPCGSRFRVSPHGLLAEACLEGVHQVGRLINLSINKNPEYFLTLARCDFLRKLSGTYEPSDLRPFCYNIEKNTQHLLVARIALDYSLRS